MLAKYCLLILLCFQLINAKKTRVTSLATLELNVGPTTDLTRAEIEYDRTVQIGENNKVILRTFQGLNNAIIYMNVTNVCEFDDFANCVEKQYKDKYIPAISTTQMRFMGSGVYEGYYAIRTPRVGSLNLVFFTMQGGLIGQVYNNQKQYGLPIKRVHDYSLNYNWGHGVIYGIRNDDLSVRWKGKFIAPETRTYQFKASFDDMFRLFVDGVLRVDYDISRGGTHKEFQFHLTKDSHDIVIEFTEISREAYIQFYWKHPANSGFSIIPSTYLRSTGSAVVSDTIEATCIPGYYLDKSSIQCKLCPSGMCQFKSGQTACEPCRAPLPPTPNGNPNNR